jgi:hypothetical protein
MGRPATCMHWFTQSSSHITSLSCLHFWKGAVLHPVENTFILRLSCLHIFTKLNSNRDVTIFFESISWALFLHKFVAKMFFFWITSLGQNFCKIPQYEKLKKPCISRFLLITKGGKNFIFKISSNFSRVLFVLNIQRWTKWNRFLWVVWRTIRTVTVNLTSTNYVEFVFDKTTSIPYWTSLLWKPLFSTLLRIDDITIYKVSDIFFTYK